MKLTDNFSLHEFLVSGTAERLGIDNTPTDDVLISIRRTANLLQSIRDLFNRAIFITSGYRCAELNEAIGSNSDPNKGRVSAHVFGCAADFKVSGLSPRHVVQTIIRSDIVFDQIICEYESWVHVAVSIDAKDKPRKMALEIDKNGTRLFA